MLLYEQCIERPRAKVIKVETKPNSKWKPLPLTTVELQQSGSRLLGMPPKRVLEVSYLTPTIVNIPACREALPEGFPQLPAHGDRPVRPGLRL